MTWFTGLSLFSLVLSLGLNIFQTKTIQKMLRREERVAAAHKQTVQELIDRLMHANGTTWTLPPREEKEIEIDEETKRFIEGWREV